MSSFKSIPIGVVLKEYGYITEEQIQQALAYQKENRGKRLGAILIEMNFITEKQMLEAMAAKLHLQHFEVGSDPVDSDAVEVIPKAMAEKYQMLAVRKKENTLSVVVNDPLNVYGLEDVRQTTGYELELLLSEKQPLEKGIQYYYSEVAAKKAARKANTSIDTSLMEELEVEEGDGDTPVINLLTSLIERAYTTTASDIHIEPFEKNTQVRMRVDGTIIDYVTLQKGLHTSLVARIKILSNLDIAERRIPQDGHFRMKIEGEYINIRVSVLPTVFGEKVVMRLLSGNSKIDHSGSFGMTKDNYEKFSKMLRSPNGIIYITGPTGSGKTTTLYMVLDRIAQKPVNISSIEDPVEKNLPRINQTQVNNLAGLTFETGLRALLRQDPDVIMVGETRDAETASISVRAAITGHLVLSTLHTNDAVSAIVRLEDMGLEPYMVANSLVGVVAQRLVRKVCPYCGEEVELTQEEIDFLQTEGVTKGKRARGCSRCNNTGYTGRIAIHEIVVIDRQIRKMVSNGATMEEISDYAINEQGMVLLRDSVIQLLKDGVTTMDEVMKIAYSA